MTMDHKEYLRTAYRHGMVLVPRKPTKSMLYVGEGITDFTLPEDVFENTKESRMREIETAWEAMIGQWEYELAIVALDMAKEKKS